MKPLHWIQTGKTRPAIQYTFFKAVPLHLEERVLLDEIRLPVHTSMILFGHTRPLCCLSRLANRVCIGDETSFRAFTVIHLNGRVPWKSGQFRTPHFPDHFSVRQYLLIVRVDFFRTKEGSKIVLFIFSQLFRVFQSTVVREEFTTMETKPHSFWNETRLLKTNQARNEPVFSNGANVGLLRVDGDRNGTRHEREKTMKNRATFDSEPCWQEPRHYLNVGSLVLSMPEPPIHRHTRPRGETPEASRALLRGLQARLKFPDDLPVPASVLRGLRSPPASRCPETLPRSKSLSDCFWVLINGCFVFFVWFRN